MYGVYYAPTGPTKIFGPRWPYEIHAYLSSFGEKHFPFFPIIPDQGRKKDFNIIRPPKPLLALTNTFSPMRARIPSIWTHTEPYRPISFTILTGIFPTTCLLRDGETTTSVQSEPDPRPLTHRKKWMREATLPADVMSYQVSHRRATGSTKGQ